MLKTHLIHLSTTSLLVAFTHVFHSNSHFPGKTGLARRAQFYLFTSSRGQTDTFHIVPSTPLSAHIILHAIKYNPAAQKYCVATHRNLSWLVNAWLLYDDIPHNVRENKK